MTVKFLALAAVICIGFVITYFHLTIGWGMEVKSWTAIGVCYVCSFFNGLLTNSVHKSILKDLK